MIREAVVRKQLSRGIARTTCEDFAGADVNRNGPLTLEENAVSGSQMTMLQRYLPLLLTASGS